MSLLDLGDRGELVGRLLVRERGLELLLPVGVGRESGCPGCASRAAWMRSISPARSLTALGDLLLLLLPALAAELRELRLALEAADVLLHQVDLRRRHVELGAVGELERQVLLARPAACRSIGLQTREPRDAVIAVHDVSRRAARSRKVSMRLARRRARGRSWRMRRRDW